MNLYQWLSTLTPLRTAPENPRRIVLILPCCIGDVVLATATLQALRRAYPDAHITWAVGSWSRQAIAQHNLLDAVLDTGRAALPVKSPLGFWYFVRLLRGGEFDLAVSLVRSPLMSAAVWLSGIPYRAGLNSAGRGFGYNIRADIDPEQPRHEAEIYLDVIRALGFATQESAVNVPVLDEDLSAVRELLVTHGVDAPYIVINPAGGQNPGMVMTSKRWPIRNFAQLAGRLLEPTDARYVVFIGGPQDGELVRAVARDVRVGHAVLVGTLSFGQIAALARESRLYIGNDTGLTHLAAAAGACTVMILGPSDPARYAPYAPNALALWKPAPVANSGVAAGTQDDWNWERDGISVDEAATQILEFLRCAPAASGNHV